MRVTTQAITVRLDRGLAKEAAAISKVTGESFKAIVERGLRREVQERLQDGRLADAVRTLRDYAVEA